MIRRRSPTCGGRLVPRAASSPRWPPRSPPADPCPVDGPDPRPTRPSSPTATLRLPPTTGQGLGSPTSSDRPWLRCPPRRVARARPGRHALCRPDAAVGRPEVAGAGDPAPGADPGVARVLLVGALPHGGAAQRAGQPDLPGRAPAGGGGGDPGHRPAPGVILGVAAGVVIMAEADPRGLVTRLATRAGPGFGRRTALGPRPQPAGSAGPGSRSRRSPTRGLPPRRSPRRPG